MAAPTSVEDYLAALPEESRAALEKLRKTIKAAALKPYFSGKGTIRFTADKPLPTALVKRIVKVRLEENAAHRRG